VVDGASQVSTLCQVFVKMADEVIQLKETVTALQKQVTRLNGRLNFNPVSLLTRNY
jgi:hypothetical protein